MPQRRVSELDDWSTCELKQLFEDISRWKGADYHFHAWRVGNGEAQLVLHGPSGQPVLSFQGRRAVAIAVLWNDVIPDRSAPNEEKKP